VPDGHYRDKFEVESGVMETLTGRRAYGRVTNTSPHAAAVEWGNRRAPAQHVLGGPSTTSGRPMPFIRYTYGPDIAEYGSDPIEVPEVTVKVLTERRRAVEVCETCPEAGVRRLPWRWSRTSRRLRGADEDAEA
jgi:hypothetical protein